MLDMWGCKQGYHMFNGKCFRHFKDYPGKPADGGFNWIESENFCAREGGHLAKPEYITEV